MNKNFSLAICKVYQNLEFLRIDHYFIKSLKVLFHFPEAIMQGNKSFPVRITLFPDMPCGTQCMKPMTQKGGETSS